VSNGAVAVLRSSPDILNLILNCSKREERSPQKEILRRFSFLQKGSKHVKLSITKNRKKIKNYL